MGRYFIYLPFFQFIKKTHMPNFTMCDNAKCELKEKCLRFVSTPSEYKQSYFSEDVRDEDGSCNFFFPINQLDLFETK